MIRFQNERIIALVLGTCSHLMQGMPLVKVISLIKAGVAALGSLALIAWASAPCSVKCWRTCGAQPLPPCIDKR